MLYENRIQSSLHILYSSVLAHFNNMSVSLFLAGQFYLRLLQLKGGGFAPMLALCFLSLLQRFDYLLKRCGENENISSFRASTD
jgi:hypothetical protein